MTDAQLWAMFLGVVAPPVIAVVQQPRWTAPAKAFVMVLFAFGIGIGTAYYNGQFTGHTIAACVMIAVIATGAAYHAVWRPTGVAPGIESATSPAIQPGRAE
ncbi:hypothetical protein ABZ883_40550 [Streptomyces sp. NPDC046977]|uniref:hypothetical protein n=1 Tax=Streptomyces sp. NPDC046977 TaxID=3154703 RepID=UPI00340DBCE8